jgi:hypothetical protein
MTHCRFAFEKSRSRPIDGSATLTIETSRIVMKNAVATTARISHRCGCDAMNVKVVQIDERWASLSTTRPPFELRN